MKARLKQVGGEYLDAKFVPGYFRCGFDGVKFMGSGETYDASICEFLVEGDPIETPNAEDQFKDMVESVKETQRRLSSIEDFLFPKLTVNMGDLKQVSVPSTEYTETATTDELFHECQIMAERVKDMKFVDSWSKYPSRLSIRTMKNGARPERYVQIKVMPSFGGQASFKVEEETLRDALVVLHRQMSERLV